MTFFNQQTLKSDIVVYGIHASVFKKVVYIPLTTSLVVAVVEAFRTLVIMVSSYTKSGRMMSIMAICCKLSV